MSGTSKWPLVAVEEFAEVTTGGTPSTSVPEYWEDGTIPWLNSGELNKGIITGSENFVTAAGLKNSSARMMPQNTVLVALTGATTGISALLKIEACANQSVTGVLPSERHDPGFLLHYLRSIRNRIVSDSWGGAQKHISQGYVKELKIPLPPLPEQRRIAAMLDKAEELRTKRRAALAELDTLTQSIFLEMFGDPVTNRNGIPIVKMGDVCDVRDGTHDSPKYVTSGGYPLVTSKNLSGGCIDLAEVNFISEADYQQINKRSKVDMGDIIMPMIGTIGSPVLVDHEPHFAIKNVALIKFKADSPSPVFVRHLLSCHYFDHIVGQKNRGGTQKFISLGDLRSFPLPLPSNAEQQEFAQRVTAIEALKAKHRTALAELDTLFASLQHRAFRGEL